MKFIVFEGCDGAGKSTQVDLLLKKLEDNKIKTKFIKFPQYEEFFGKLVTDYLLGKYGDIKHTDSHLIALTYALDRYDAKKKIQSWIDKGYVVVCDRYFGSQAHQAAKLSKSERIEFLHWVTELEYLKLGIVKEDVIVYLDVPEKVSYELMGKRKQRLYIKKKRDLHEADINHLRETRNVYLEMARGKDWIKIDCVKKDKLLSKEDIAETIWKKLKPLL